MAKRLATSLLTGLVLAVLALTGCGDDDADSDSGSTLPTGSEPTELDPADFTTGIDNPYWPMTPGSRWVYREREADATLKVVVTVTDRTKMIANGIEARVVHDVVTEDGEPIEITDDFYAEDAEGNIWYLGEETAEYEQGKIASRAGSFEAGVGGAEAGIAMPAQPEVGLTYRQEYLAGEAEDFATVLSLDATAEVPFGSFDRVLQTEDVNPLEKPRAVEHKYYARDVGPVLTVGLSGSGGREELVSYRPGN